MINTRELGNSKISSFYSAVESNNFTAVFGSDFGERTILASELKSFVYVATDYIAAREVYRQISSIRTDAVYLPAKDDVLTYVRGKSDDSAFTRLSALTAIAAGKTSAVITNLEAIMQLFPLRSDFISGIVELVCGKEYQIQSIIERLVRGGYKREALVSAKGQFAARGDILDVTPINSDIGYRLEFFGDELETIKSIDFSTQKSVGSFPSLLIPPATEAFFKGNESSVISAIRNDIPTALDTESKHKIENIVSEIEFNISQNLNDTKMSFILPYISHGSFWEFISPDSASSLPNSKAYNSTKEFVIIFDEIKSLSAKIVFNEHANRFKQLLEKGAVLPRSLSQIMEDSLLVLTNQTALGRGNRILGYYANSNSCDIFQPNHSFTFDTMTLPSYTKNFAALFEDILIWTNKGMQIVIFAGSEDVRERLADQLRERNLSFSCNYNSHSSFIYLLAEELYHGSVLFEHNLVLIGTYDIISKKAKKTIKRSRKEIFSQPEIGDYVVHETHGIGICESVQKLVSGNSARDYLVIGYRDGDKLFVPVENMDSLTRYNSAEERPRLSKIGGAEFAKAKERARLSVKKMAFDLLKLYAERSMERGYEYAPYATEMHDFALDFPFVETDDQLQAIEEGLNDMSSGKIMDRLLCGDVGYGKTEVALRLAYNAILNGKQVAFIAPTTILARQHFLTVKERLGKFGVNAVSLNRLNSQQQTDRAIADIALKKADIAVGTHRLLSKDVKFADLGLMILDEEQRFGVADKEKIKLLKKNVSVLALSATPIPRTLHMSMSGIRDISVLDTPPCERIPVQTYVLEYSDSLLIDAVGRELGRGGQVFIVYNRVATIDSFSARIRELTGEEVSVIHGQLDKKVMEDRLSAFVAGETQILIASTIIENGIDMPRANTMIVIDADRLGLSQLYQLRGRVGRSNRLAYAFFTYDDTKMLTETAVKRLESINEFTEFGSGFKIAMRDLQIRGAGNILGREQHGQMEKIGYDMYLKILSEEIEKLKGTEVKGYNEIKVNIDFDAFIPESYIQDNEWRIKVYSRISHIGSEEEIERLKEELTDIYGTVPTSLLNLCFVAMIKNLAKFTGCNSITIKKTATSLNYQNLKSIPQSAVERINTIKSATLTLSPPAITFRSKEELLAFLSPNLF